MIFTTNDIRIEGAVGGGVKVSFFTTDASFYNELMHKYSGRDYTVEIKEKRPKRSLDANAYCWHLCSKIAEHKDVLLSKEEVYKKAIKDYGFSAVMPINDEQLTDILRQHVAGRTGCSYDIIGPSKFAGYTNVMFYYGSSEYSTALMSHLIDGIVADAKELGIETMTPHELEQMKEAWK